MKDFTFTILLFWIAVVNVFGQSGFKNYYAFGTQNYFYSNTIIDDHLYIQGIVKYSPGLYYGQMIKMDTSGIIIKVDTFLTSNLSGQGMSRKDYNYLVQDLNTKDIVSMYWNYEGIDLYKHDTSLNRVWHRSVRAADSTITLHPIELVAYENGYYISGTYFKTNVNFQSKIFICHLDLDGNIIDWHFFTSNNEFYDGVKILPASDGIVIMYGKLKTSWAGTYFLYNTNTKQRVELRKDARFFDISSLRKGKNNEYKAVGLYVTDDKQNAYPNVLSYDNDFNLLSATSFGKRDPDSRISGYPENPSHSTVDFAGNTFAIAVCRIYYWPLFDFGGISLSKININNELEWTVIDTFNFDKATNLGFGLEMSGINTDINGNIYVVGNSYGRYDGKYALRPGGWVIKYDKFGKSLNSYKLLSAVNDVNDPRATIEVYPNPVSHELYIKTSDYPSIDYFSLYNLVGREVKRYEHITSSVSTISTSRLENGFYIFKAYRKGKVIKTEKIIIMK